ncbi:MAG: hypothetical protein J1G07_01160 [Clostridiales bacterium]|nr:hypothetical protein [Clostridiales bacterium]
MKRINLPLILDTLFAAVCAFLLFFTAIRFYTKSPAIGLIFGIVAALLFGTLAFIYISTRQSKSFLISHDEKQKKLLALHLTLSSDAYVKNLFLKCFENAEISGKRVICGGVSYFFNFKMQNLSEDDIAQIIKEDVHGDKAIYCVKTAPDAYVLAENFGIKIITIEEVYELLKSKDLLPEKYIYEDQKRANIFKRIRARFSRKLCAPLFWSGLALLLLSYFTFFPIYYIVSGGLMLILAACALVLN